MIRITTKKDGFRRAGMAHHGTKDYPDDAFTPEQIAQLEAEPMLVVQRLEGEPSDTPGEGAPDGQAEAAKAAKASKGKK